MSAIVKHMHVSTVFFCVAFNPSMEFAFRYSLPRYYNRTLLSECQSVFEFLRLDCILLLLDSTNFHIRLRHIVTRTFERFDLSYSRLKQCAIRWLVTYFKCFNEVLTILSQTILVIKLRRRLCVLSTKRKWHCHRETWHNFFLTINVLVCENLLIKLTIKSTKIVSEFENRFTWIYLLKWAKNISIDRLEYK